MAKIKVQQSGGVVTITRAGETKDTFRVSEDGLITVRKDQVADLLKRLRGSELVEGTLEEEVDLTDTTTNPPAGLPTEEERAATAAAEAEAQAKAEAKARADAEAAAAKTTRSR